MIHATLKFKVPCVNAKPRKNGELGYHDLEFYFKHRETDGDVVTWKSECQKMFNLEALDYLSRVEKESSCYGIMRTFQEALRHTSDSLQTWVRKTEGCPLLREWGANYLQDRRQKSKDRSKTTEIRYSPPVPARKEQLLTQVFQKASGIRHADIVLCREDKVLIYVNANLLAVGNRRIGSLRRTYPEEIRNYLSNYNREVYQLHTRNKVSAHRGSTRSRTRFSDRAPFFCGTCERTFYTASGVLRHRRSDNHARTFTERLRLGFSAISRDALGQVARSPADRTFTPFALPDPKNPKNKVYLRMPEVPKRVYELRKSFPGAAVDAYLHCSGFLDYEEDEGADLCYKQCLARNTLQFVEAMGGPAASVEQRRVLHEMWVEDLRVVPTSRKFTLGLLDL